jgi:sRNA-binding regulator protein Hfq
MTAIIKRFDEHTILLKADNRFGSIAYAGA